MRLEDETLYAQTHYNLGECYLRQQAFRQAAHHSQEAISYFEPLLESDEQIRYWLAVSYNTLGEAQRAQKEDETAVASFLHAIEIIEKTDHTLYHTRFKSNLALAYESMEKLDQAAQQLEESLALLQQTPYEIDKMRQQLNLGFIFMSQEKWDKAIEQLQTIDPVMLEECGQHFLSGLAHMNLGVALFNVSMYSAAIDHLEKSIPIWDKIKDSLCLGHTYGVLGKIFKAQNNTQLSKHYFLQAIEILHQCNHLIKAAELTQQYQNQLSLLNCSTVEDTADS
ncbi:MAG: tetratricopeptide repeat protein [Sphaerospermopsis sp. SIO1G2]|nr:tetratricopeptide repeat protein [Sphaerospermopsis sp. SIO1G2]